MRQKFMKFMSGRYGLFGVDALNFLLLIIYILLSFFGGFIMDVRIRLGLRALSLLAVGYAIFRLLSKNIYARRKENAAFKKAWSAVKSFFKLQYDRIKNIKKYRYRKCPHCKAVLQLPLPKKSGKNSVVCPKCHERFSVYNLF